MRSVDFILCAGPSLQALSKGRRDGVALWAARSGVKREVDRSQAGARAAGEARRPGLTCSSQQS